MQATNYRRALVTTNNGAVHRHEIVADAKLFDVLSNKMYERKHEAVVREISCNATDAHVRAGCRERPFDVHLPTTAEPYLAIRDYGTGMSPDEVETQYDIVGASDALKTNSNEYMGVFGLGAHAPFCCVDQFVVTSWHEGTKYVYAIFKDTDGCPATAAQHAEPSNEPAGVEVSLATVPADVTTWHNAAKAALAYFRTQPKVNLRGFAAGRPKYTARTATYGLHGGDSHVVMGDVAYPIDAAAVGLEYKYRDTSPAALLLRHGIDFDLPIGAVNVTASREGLSYDPATIAAVRAAVEAAVADLIAAATAAVAAAPSRWRAHVAYNEWAGRLNFLGQLAPQPWRGGTVDGVVAVPADAEIVGWYKRERRYKDKSDVWRHEDAVGKVLATPDYEAVLVGDVPLGVYATARRCMEANGWKKAILLREDDPAALAALIAEQGWDDLVVRLSTVPKPKVVRTPRGRIERTTLRRWCSYGNFRNAEVDVAAGGVYVVAVRDKVRPPGRDGVAPTEEPKVLRNVVAHLTTLTGTEPEIFGIVPSQLDWLKRRGPWVALDDWARARLTEAVPRLLPAARLIAADRDWSGRGFNRLANQRFVAGSVFANFLKLHGRAAKAAKDDNVRSFRALAAVYRDVVTIEPDPDYAAAQEDTRKKYPLLFWGHSLPTDELKHAVQYIRLVDGGEDLPLFDETTPEPVEGPDVEE